MPENDLRRRFKVSLQNLFNLYRPVVDTWTLHANELLRPRVIAHGTATEMEVLDESAFEKVRADFSITV